MFDLVLGKVERPYRRSSRGATIASVIGHIVVVTLVLVLPLMWATQTLPETPVIMAFVAHTAAPPPPHRRRHRRPCHVLRPLRWRRCPRLRIRTRRQSRLRTRSNQSQPWRRRALEYSEALKAASRVAYSEASSVDCLERRFRLRRHPRQAISRSASGARCRPQRSCIASNRSTRRSRWPRTSRGW